MKRKLFNPDKCECWDCGREFPYLGVDSPMVMLKTWDQIAKDEPQIQYYTKDGDTWEGGGYLCQSCMEKRLGRPLKYEDLMTFDDGSPMPFNRWYIEKYYPEKMVEYERH